MGLLKIISGLLFTLGLLLIFGAVGSMDAGNAPCGVCAIRAGIGLILMIASAVIGNKIEENE